MRVLVMVSGRSSVFSLFGGRCSVIGQWDMLVKSAWGVADCRATTAIASGMLID